MNDAIKDSNLYEAIFQSSAQGILVVDEEGFIIKANLASARMFGYHRSELINKKIELLIPKEYRAKHENHRKSFHKKPKNRPMGLGMELKGVKKNGEQFPIEVSLSPILLNKKKTAIAFTIDITELKKATNSLYEKERALESTANGVLIADAQQADIPITYVNKAFVTITGYGKSEAIGKNCRFLQNDDRDQKEILEMRSAIENGKSCQVVLRNYRKDGSMFWNEVTFTPIRDDMGKLTHFIGILNDVTERKKEELLKESIRKSMEMITRHLPLTQICDHIAHTFNNNIDFFFASILILDNESNKLHNLSGSSLPNELNRAMNGIPVIAEGGCCCSKTAFSKKAVLVVDLENDPLYKEYEQLMSQNNLKACWSFPIISSKGTVLGVFAIYGKQARKPSSSEKDLITDLSQLAGLAIEQYNVTDTLRKNKEQLEAYSQELEEKVKVRTEEVTATIQKLVESNLQLEDQMAIAKTAKDDALASQVMLAAIAHNFPKGIIVVVNADYTIIYVEGGELNKVGFEKNDLMGIKLDELLIFSKGQREKLKEDVTKTLEGQHLSFQVNYKVNTYSVHTTPLYTGDHVIAALFVYTDISTQKKVELEILNALKKEQELNQLKSRFISLASHEFRTPLSAILSSAALIEKQNQPGLEEKREKYINKIKANVKNLMVILNDFLSLSKLEEGKINIQPEFLDLVQFSKAIVEEIETTKKQGQVIELVHSLPIIKVYMDPKLVRHILLNLLSNAIKYSHQNKEIRLSIDKKGKRASIKIEDQGIGIPKKERVNLFKRFYRAENAANFQGTGLGLHLVKNYLDLVGGSISFSSELHKGTIFIVELPLNQKQDEKNTDHRGQ